MKTLWIIAITLSCGSAFAQQRNPVVIKEPGRIVVPAQEQRAAKPPREDYQRVAVLSIRLDVDNGKVQSARVASSKHVASYAPKVFARRAGDWEVTIEGDTRKSFFVNNPALREAEAHPSSDDRYQWVGDTGTIDWPLVVPLYDAGRSLGARSITIRDTHTGATILEAPL